jgi:hypothetical protein
MFKCSFAVEVWAALGADVSTSSVRNLWAVPRPETIPAKHYSCFILLVCWSLWKHRNDTVFASASPSLARFWRSCQDEVRLWCLRLPRAEVCSSKKLGAHRVLFNVSRVESGFSPSFSPCAENLVTSLIRWGRPPSPGDRKKSS